MTLGVCPLSIFCSRPQVNRFVSDEKFPTSLKEEIQAHFTASANLVADYSQAEPAPAREFFIDNLLVRIHFIIVMIRWTGLAHQPPSPLHFLLTTLLKHVLHPLCMPRPHPPL